MSRFWLNGYFNFVKNLEEGRRLFIRNVRKLGHKWVLFDPGEDERIFKGGGGEAHSLGKCVCSPKKRGEGIAKGETWTG